MKFLSRFFSFLAAFAGLITHFRLTDGFAMNLAYPKILSGALSPVLALLGGIGTAVSLIRRDGVGAFIGFLGTALTLHHIKAIAAPHDKFNESFGPGWENQLPPAMRPRLRPARYLPGPFDPHDVPWQADLVIGQTDPGQPLLADLWQPPDDIPRTGLGIIYLHGSGWHYIDKDMGTRRLFRYLAGQGHVVLDVAYTLAPAVRLPGMMADVKRAIAWMKTNADQLGFGQNKVVLFGGSAGGHLALLAAYTPNHPAFQPADIGDADTAVHGVISYYGITHLASAHAHLSRIPPPPGGRVAEIVEQIMVQTRVLPSYGRLIAADHLIPSLMGGLPKEMPDAYELGSPLSHAGPHCPPTLLLNGAHDFGIEPTQHSRMHAALGDHAVRSIHYEIPYAEHAFDLVFPRWAPATQSALYDTERFLALLM